MERRETLGTFYTLRAAAEARERVALELRKSGESFCLEIMEHDIGMGAGKVIEEITYESDGEDWVERKVKP